MRALSAASPPARSSTLQRGMPTSLGSRLYRLVGLPAVTSTTSAGPIGVSSSRPIEWTTSAFFMPRRWGLGGGGGEGGLRRRGARVRAQAGARPAARASSRRAPCVPPCPNPEGRQTPHHERLRHELADGCVVHPDQAVLRARGVEQRPQHVEGSAHLEGGAEGGGQKRREGWARGARLAWGRSLKGRKRRKPEHGTRARSAGRSGLLVPHPAPRPRPPP
jgi:hypothetical protein